MSLPDDELKNKVEALLFSVGKTIDINELAKLVRCKDLLQLELVLKELKENYNSRDSPLLVINDGTFWKIVVREKYGHVVKKVVADVELSKTLMETLALVAWKNPVKQSEIIEIRSNKGYDHLNELERIGFITKKKYGRTQLVSLTEKFFNYFELSGHEDIKEAFKKIKEIEERKMQEYAQKKAEMDLRRKKSDEVKIINQKSFLERVDRQLEKDLRKEQINQQEPLENEVKKLEEEQAEKGIVEQKVIESKKEEESGIESEATDEKEETEYFEDKLDKEGMPDLNADKDNEEEEILDEEQEEKKKKKE